MVLGRAGRGEGRARGQQHQQQQQQQQEREDRQEQDVPRVTLDWRLKAAVQTPDELAAIFLPISTVPVPASTSTSATDPAADMTDSEGVALSIYRPDYASRTGGGGGRDLLTVQLPGVQLPGVPMSPSLSQSQSRLGSAFSTTGGATSAGAAAGGGGDAGYVEVAVQRQGGDESEGAGEGVGPGWVWGPAVNSLFAVVEVDGGGEQEDYLSAEEKRLLAFGDILLTRDLRGEQGAGTGTGTVILRAQAAPPGCPASPSGTGGMPPSIAAVVAQLQRLVTRAIRQADSISLSGGAIDCRGLVIVPPVSLSFFSQHLSAQEVEVLCLRAVVEHVRTHQIFSLQRIVCLEVSQISQPPSSLPQPPSFLAETLFLLVKEDVERNLDAEREGVQVSSAVSRSPFVSSCEDSAVMAVIAHLQQEQELEHRGRRTRQIALKQQQKPNQQKLKQKQQASGGGEGVFTAEVPDPRRRGTHVVLLRGTASCLLCATTLISSLLRREHTHGHSASDRK